ncbi:MAG: universal stress protein [Alphaproteobacteria bacterium]|nr:universal stress protein [Alphaproteobacteria bacterium]
MTGTRRRSYEAGHRPKFLIVIDETDECDRAIYFAAKRAARVAAGLTMLNIMAEAEHGHWLGVGDIMKAEAEEAADSMLERAAARVREMAGIESEKVRRTGQSADVIRDIINEDEDISFLILAASAGNEGPGPLVSQLAGKSSGTFPIPIVIVPGDMSDEAIDALA